MSIELIGNSEPRRVAILYQAVPPPVIDGLRKDAKPGGYSDSGADIAFRLRRHGVDVATPTANPDPAAAFDWVFPDTEDGLRAATAAGATVIWANTVLFRGHPIERYLASHWIVGQRPDRQEAVDDKFATNALLRARGLPVASAILAALQRAEGVCLLATLSAEFLATRHLAFPLVVKPVRGRGGQGVTRVDDLDSLRTSINALIASNLFGDCVIVEQYLNGEELTVTVMPGADGPSVLPPVRRFNHVDGIAPYNGAVAVTANSEVLDAEACAAPPVRALAHACAAIFAEIGPWRLSVSTAVRTGPGGSRFSTST